MGETHASAQSSESVFIVGEKLSSLNSVGARNRNLTISGLTHIQFIVSETADIVSDTCCELRRFPADVR